MTSWEFGGGRGVLPTWLTVNYPAICTCICKLGPSLSRLTQFVQPWRWKQRASSNTLCRHTRLHGVTFQTTTVWTIVVCKNVNIHIDLVDTDIWRLRLCFRLCRYVFSYWRGTYIHRKGIVVHPIGNCLTICTLSKPGTKICDYWHLHVYLSIRTHRGDSHWTDFPEDSYLGFLLNFVYLLRFWLNYDKNHSLHEDLCTLWFIAVVGFRNSVFSVRYALKQRKHFSIE